MFSKDFLFLCSPDLLNSSRPNFFPIAFLLPVFSHHRNVTVRRSSPVSSGGDGGGGGNGWPVSKEHIQLFITFVEQLWALAARQFNFFFCFWPALISKAKKKKEFYFITFLVGCFVFVLLICQSLPCDDRHLFPLLSLASFCFIFLMKTWSFA